MMSFLTSFDASYIRRSDPFDAACHASLNSRDSAHELVIVDGPTRTTPKVMAMDVAAPGELRGTLEVPVVKDIGVRATVGSITAWYNIAHRTRTSLTSPRLDRRPRMMAEQQAVLGAPRVSRG